MSISRRHYYSVPLIGAKSLPVPNIGMTHNDPIANNEHFIMIRGKLFRIVCPQMDGRTDDFRAGTEMPFCTAPVAAVSLPASHC